MRKKNRLAAVRGGLNIRRVVTCALAFVMVASGAAFAYTPQTVYTYNVHGEPIALKQTYEVDEIITGESLGIGAFSSAQSLSVENGRVIICDSGNARVVVVRNGKVERVVTTYNEINDLNQANDSNEATVSEVKLRYPSDAHFDANGRLFIADTLAGRIVALDESNNAIGIIENVSGDLLQTGFKFQPKKFVLDRSGRVYVIAQGVTMGIMELDMDSNIKRFIGATKVQVNAMEQFWKLIANDQQYNKLSKNIPTEYSNIIIDDDDFINGTVATISSGALKTAIWDSIHKVDGVGVGGKSLLKTITDMFKLFKFTTTGEKQIVKKLNLKGNDILHRTGYYDVAGEVDFAATLAELPSEITNAVVGSSVLVDIARHDSGVYSVLDELRGRIFTYDSEGVLLYIFGGTGNAEGLFTKPASIAYVGDDIWVLDSVKNSITVFTPNDFVRNVFDGYKTYRDGDYQASLAHWQETVHFCSNFDVGYIGVGRAYYRLGEYEKAMESYRVGEYRSGYNKAYLMLRSELIKRHFGRALFVAVALIAVVVAFKYYRRKHPKRNTLRDTKLARYWRSVKYASHVAVHPFDGYYDIKAEKRGSLLAATTFLALNAGIAVLTTQYSGFLFNFNVNAAINASYVVISVVLPTLLFVVANWSVTTLMDGEGSVADIYKATGYSMAPMLVLQVLALLLTQILSIREIALLNMVRTLGTLWFALLLFFGLATTHQYTVKRNIGAFILTIVAMMAILFIALLLLSLVGRVQGFFGTIINEVMLRR